VDFNSIEALDQLQLPADKNLIAYFHFYSPFEFTHQGASWIEGSNEWLGASWMGTAEEKQAIEPKLDLAQTWSKNQKIPVFMGEFGTISSADHASCGRWMQFVVNQADERNIGWGYWEFCSIIGIYDCQKHEWDQTLLQSLMVR
jgi:endoglucanase